MEVSSQSKWFGTQASFVLKEGNQVVVGILHVELARAPPLVAGLRVRFQDAQRAEFPVQVVHALDFNPQLAVPAMNDSAPETTGAVPSRVRQASSEAAQRWIAAASRRKMAKPSSRWIGVKPSLAR
jgi:hypothetical protein